MVSGVVGAPGVWRGLEGEDGLDESSGTGLDELGIAGMEARRSATGRKEQRCSGQGPSSRRADL